MKILLFLINLSIFHLINTQNALRRINNGQAGTIEMFPYMVGITHSLKKHYCGGAILTDRWVISARHCFKRKGRRQYYVTFGNDRQSFEDIVARHIIPIREILFYEGTGTSTKVHDIALLKMQFRIPIDGKYITPVNLPLLGNFYGGTIGSFSGFGMKIDSNNNLVDTDSLQFMNVRVLHNSESMCKNTIQNICVEGIDEEAMACSGDSGSPLVLRGTQIIIGVLHGTWKGCEATNKTLKLSRITFYADWIAEQTGLKFQKKDLLRRKNSYTLNYFGQ